MRGRTIALIAAAGVMTAAPVAHADHDGIHDQPLFNWPELLPANPDNSPGTASLPWDVCAAGSADCPPAVIREMTRRWTPLDARCNHKAVFALTYLRTTEEFWRTVQDDPGFFTDNPWINHEDAVFAELYFEAYDNWHRKRRHRVPTAWRVAFRAAESGHLTAAGDLLLGMNAHIQRDLPYTLAHVGLVKPGGTSRKLDHDRVNEFLDRVADPLQDELERRYDPYFRYTDASPSPLDEVGVLQAVRGMRENAWRNAERLVNARGRVDRKLARQTIEREAAVAARAIRATNTIPRYGAQRDAYCRTGAWPLPL